VAKINTGAATTEKHLVGVPSSKTQPRLLPPGRNRTLTVYLQDREVLGLAEIHGALKRSSSPTRSRFSVQRLGYRSVYAFF
jgi:hypothetical protein